MTEIAFILDRSGSMGIIRRTAIAGFNEFLGQQKAVGTAARFTLALFDNEYEVPVHSIPLCEVTELTADTYVPRGGTALLDAIGRTIDELGSRLAALPEEKRPDQVVVAILTDGLENASRRFALADISAKISHQREKYNWQFFFLGANQDAIASAVSLSIDANDTATYIASNHGIRASSRSISRKLSAIRKSRGRIALSDQEQSDLTASLSQILNEESGEGRE